MTELVVNLRHADATDACRFGPKAANQSILGRAGLPIPEGFCLDARGYRLQLESLGLLASVREAANPIGDAARQFVSEVRIGLFDSPIVPEVLDPLLEAWHKLVRATGESTVVRSSALTEDLAGSSFAGQFETFLDLDNEADFLTAVRACWAALWSPRAIRYMGDHQMKPTDTAMGLCIQTLIQSRMSGGGMSRTADGNMSLTATWGLGTTIAQGEIVPDRYILSPDGKLLESVAGRNEHSVFCVNHHDLHAAKSKQSETVAEPCLGESQAIELGRMLKCAERLFGEAVEIEWTHDDIGFRMLQARPLQMEPARVPDEMWSRRRGLRGQPSGVGWGSGRACVISCECELSRIAPGDVLVTKIASPALSHVLPRVAGVVAELGGSTSHLASLARERGIPMVLGVLEATQKIPDGVQIGVDGVIGMVRWQH
jgi:pyruvate,water dikinase